MARHEGADGEAVPPHSLADEASNCLLAVTSAAGDALVPLLAPVIERSLGEATWRDHPWRVREAAASRCFPFQHNLLLPRPPSIILQWRAA